MQTETQKPDQPSPTTSDEIDLIELIRHIWNGRWLIVKVTGVFIIIGLIIALTSPNQYKAEARLLPEVRDTQAGGASALLRQFSGMGGFNMPGMSGADAIRPDLYPDVLKSTPFFVDLLGHTIKVRQENSVEEIDVLTYLTNSDGFSLTGIIKKYTIGLPGTIIGWFRSSENENQSSSESGILDNINQLNQIEFDIIKDLRNRINAGIDQRSGVISISAEFPDPFIAAQIADFAVKYLIEYITLYRIEKAQKELLFVKERHEEKKSEFHQAQQVLAIFRDANMNIITASARTEEQRLQDQYNLAFNVYNGLAQQLEQARIKVQEETPVIQLLEPVQVPVEKSKPRRSLIMAISIFLGGIFGLGLVFGNIFWVKIRSQIN
jgi:uncharacterized protein involved in exopolysaccharide biosynthesis